MVVKDDTEEDLKSVTNTDNDHQQEGDEGSFTSIPTIPSIKIEGKSPVTEHQNVISDIRHQYENENTMMEIHRKRILSETSDVERKEKPDDMDMETDVSPYTVDTKRMQNVNKMAFKSAENDRNKVKEWHSEEAKTPTPSYKTYEI